MSRVTPLYEVDSFRDAVQLMLDTDDASFAALQRGGIELISATTLARADTPDDYARRAFALLYDAAVRDGLAEVEPELRQAFSGASATALDRLVAAIRPTSDAKERVAGVEARDGFLPILTGHRLALDLRVIDSSEGAPIATPFVSARFEFDSAVAGAASSIVWQLNLADIDSLVSALSEVRERAARLVAGAGDLTIPEWGHGLPA